MGVSAPLPANPGPESRPFWLSWFWRRSPRLSRANDRPRRSTLRFTLTARIWRSWSRNLRRPRRPSATAAVVVESLARETRKRVLLIDALDEASDIGGIVDLILKLAVAAPALRILLSAREDAFKRFPKSACVMLDLDDQRYWDHEDIRRYVERRLWRIRIPRIGVPPSWSPIWPKRSRPAPIGCSSSRR